MVNAPGPNACWRLLTAQLPYGGGRPRRSYTDYGSPSLTALCDPQKGGEWTGHHTSGWGLVSMCSTRSLGVSRTPHFHDATSPGSLVEYFRREVTILCKGLRGVFCAVDRSSLELLSKPYANLHPVSDFLVSNPERRLLLYHLRIFFAYYEVNLLSVSNHSLSRFRAVSRGRPECPLSLVVLAQRWTVCDSSNINQTGCARSALYMWPLGCARRVSWTLFAWPFDGSPLCITPRRTHLFFIVRLPSLKRARCCTWQSIS
ncbi:hypothetical protein EDD85DRAFT_556281 [Armillaria nabsnona]|nr:hypothetical protein EDD85DRAFT_556281 [Armillaria nabsnona]